MKKQYLLFLSLFLTAQSSSNLCPQFFANNQTPVITSKIENQQTVQICHDAYSTGYSNIVQDPLWSAEVLTEEGLKNKIKGRHGIFHTDDQLPFNMYHVTPNDYHNPKGQYWDRGHMVPSGDMPTQFLQGQTFAMTNMIPQDADNNEQLHEGIETATRQLAKDYGKIYVITGPIFRGRTLERLNGHSYIPTQIFKAIYIPNFGAGVYIENNKPDNRYSIISLTQLQELANINIFPNIREQFKTQAFSLPKPNITFKGGSRESRAKHFKEPPPQQVSLDTLLSEKKE